MMASNITTFYSTHSRKKKVEKRYGAIFLNTPSDHDRLSVHDIYGPFPHSDPAVSTHNERSSGLGGFELVLVFFLVTGMHMIMSETLVVSSRGGIADFGLTKGAEDEKPIFLPI